MESCAFAGGAGPSDLSVFAHGAVCYGQFACYGVVRAPATRLLSDAARYVTLPPLGNGTIKTSRGMIHDAAFPRGACAFHLCPISEC